MSLKQPLISRFPPTQQGYFQSPYREPYKKRKTKYYYQTGLEEFGSKPVKNDPKSGMNTQAVLPNAKK